MTWTSLSARSSNSWSLRSMVCCSGHRLPITSGRPNPPASTRRSGAPWWISAQSPWPSPNHAVAGGPRCSISPWWPNSWAEPWPQPRSSRRRWWPGSWPQSDLRPLARNFRRCCVESGSSPWPCTPSVTASRRWCPPARSATPSSCLTATVWCWRARRRPAADRSRIWGRRRWPMSRCRVAPSCAVAPMHSTASSLLSTSGCC